MFLAAGAESAEARAAAEVLLARDLHADMVTADTGEESSTDTADDSSTMPLLLTCSHGGAQAVVGVLVLVDSAELTARYYATARGVCHALIDAGDVAPKFR